MTKARALKLVNKKFCSAKGEFWIGPLCIQMPDKLRYDWKMYWKQINTTNVDTVMDVFGFSESPEPIIITRLLLIYNFIEDTYV